MSAQEGFHHPRVHSHDDALAHRVEHALRVYGALTEEQLRELLCPRTDGHAHLRSVLGHAVAAGHVRHVGPLYAPPPRS